jgi:hypothetical protein
MRASERAGAMIDRSVEGGARASRRPRLGVAGGSAVPFAGGDYGIRIRAA